MNLTTDCPAASTIVPVSYDGNPAANQLYYRSAEEGRYDTEIPKPVGDEKSIMKRVKILFLLPLALLLLPAALAATPQTGTGHFSTTITNAQSRTAGGNTITTQDETFTITGVMTGSCSGSETNTLHPDGTLTGHGTCAFSGTIQGQQVSGTFQFNGAGTPTSFNGHFGTTRGSDVHIQGTFQPTSMTAGDYTANFHFGP